MAELPSGTVTLLFSDIEGSTRLLLRLGAAYPDILEQHRTVLGGAVAAAGGYLLDTQGDACFAVFGRASEAITAAAAIQTGLADHPWPDGARVRVRIGVHTGEPTVTANGYAGVDVHRAARICSAGNGGQILVSGATADLMAASLPAGLVLSELGSYRFKDFSFAERLYQLDVAGLPTTHAPLRTLQIPFRLPGQHRAMIGRERELAQARQLLLASQTRLLTLTGPAGAGKTRLAIAVADSLHDVFDDGICFVPLGNVIDPALVPSAIAQALGVRDVVNRASRELLVDILGGREQLVMLDNMEQVLDAATLVAEVLAACPRLKVLATSREPLHLTGERELPVAPLELPPETLSSPQAARQALEMAAPKLFIERAREAKRDFRPTDADAPVIAAICRRLDGLPLAIELAAARVRFLPPGALLQRLDRRLAVLTGGPRDLPARQQTLRAAISWSHDILDDRDRVVFRRSSVFAGGWTLEAAEAVCGFEDDPLATIDALSSLVDKSLIQREELPDGEARFSMLGTVREFAQEQLANSDEYATICRRYAAFYLEITEEAAPHLALDATQLEWIERLDAESANLHAVFEWSAAPLPGDRAEMGLRLSAALWRFWAARSSAREARNCIDAVIRLAAGSPATSAKGKALFGAASLARELSDYETTERLLTESLEIARMLGETRQVADVLHSLGWLHVLRGNLSEARVLLEESLRLFERLADASWKAMMLARLAYVCFMEGAYDRAMTLASESATIARVIGDQRALADALVYQGLVQQYAGDLEQARRRFQEALPIARSFRDRHLLSMTLNLIGQYSARHGSHEEARRYLAEGLRLAREVGNLRRLSFSLSAVASLAMARGEPSAGLRFEGASRAAARSIGTVRAQSALAAIDADLERARAALGEPSATAAFEHGQQAPLDMTVDDALAWLGDPGLERLEEADMLRWQSSPWAVFGWVGQSGAEAPRAGAPAGNSGRPVYGEGGVGPGR